MRLSKNNIFKALREFQFNPPTYVEGCGSITEFLPDTRKSGIYVLHFGDDTYYVGQSVEVARRFSQHVPNFEDIRAISFRPVAISQLSYIEKQTVHLLEDIGVKLRNILLSSFTHAKTNFAEIMSESEQEKWLSDLSFVDLRGLRRVDEDLRRKYSVRYQTFINDPKADEVVQFLRCYIPVGIACILQGEASYWAISCLPGANVKVFCRVNIYWQEVLTIYEDKGTLFFSLHLANSLAPIKLTEIEKNNFEITDHRYFPGGDDQINFIFIDLHTALTALKNQGIQNAIRRFNLGLMRKGICQYGRYHCYDLADKII